MTEIKLLKDYLVKIVDGNGLVTHEALSLKIKSEFLGATDQEVLTALSEAAQEGLIKRFEYNIPSKGYNYRYFYLPYNARLS